MAPVVKEVAIRRKSYWIDSQGSQLLTHAHIPAGDRMQPMAVLICSPLGYEAIHVHRSLVYLADILAEAGYLALRFDYRGTGNSSADSQEAGLFDSWQANIRDQVHSIREDWGIADICMLGFRFGANLAAVNAAATNTARLILWEPIIRGRTYVREIKAAAMSATATNETQDALHESGGFIFTDETVRHLQHSDLSADILPDETPTLLIARPSGQAKLPSAIKELPRCSLAESDEYLDMLAEPHYTVLPKQAIAQIIAWLPHAETATRIERPTIPEFAQSATVYRNSRRPATMETIIRIAGPGLFGILTEPLAGDAAKHPLVVFCNAGSVCNVGPNRLYVELARELAVHGYSSVRIDLRNLGESVVGAVEEANLPYPGTAVADIQEFLAYVAESQPYSKFILSGLCSGAFTSYRTALAETSAAVVEIIMINPLTFHWVTGMTMINPEQHNLVRQAHYYDNVIRIGQNWKNLLTGKTQYRRLLRFLARYLFNTLETMISRVLRLFHLIEESQLTRELMELEKRGILATFIFSKTDPGHWILMADAAKQVRRSIRHKRMNIEFIANADHTFSKVTARQSMIETFVHGLERHYSNRNPQATRNIINAVPVRDRS